MIKFIRSTHKNGVYKGDECFGEPTKFADLALGCHSLEPDKALSIDEIYEVCIRYCEHNPETKISVEDVILDLADCLHRGLAEVVVE